jgi:hypothetical protein
MRRRIYVAHLSSIATSSRKVTLDIVPRSRSLTDRELARLARERERVIAAEQYARKIVREAIVHRDRAIAEIVSGGASQTGCADALGITRQAIHNAIRRAAGDSEAS